MGGGLLVFLVHRSRVFSPTPSTRFSFYLFCFPFRYLCLKPFSMSPFKKRISFPKLSTFALPTEFIRLKNQKQKNTITKKQTLWLFFWLEHFFSWNNLLNLSFVSQILNLLGLYVFFFILCNFNLIFCNLNVIFSSFERIQNCLGGFMVVVVVLGGLANFHLDPLSSQTEHCTPVATLLLF